LGHTLGLLSALYPGYSVTYLGSVVGLVYGLVSGALEIEGRVRAMPVFRHHSIVVELRWKLTA
jgi:hypothetical protein